MSGIDAGQVDLNRIRVRKHSLGSPASVFR